MTQNYFPTRSHLTRALVAVALTSSAVLPTRAQNLIDFESFDLPQDTFLNGSDGEGGFTAGAVFLPNSYNEQSNSWSDWSISTTTDTTTPGFTNSFSAFPGGGAEGTLTYATAFAFTGTRIDLVDTATVVEEVYVTNSTYAALSMREGDQFSKRFGGVTGDDPDFFTVTFHGWRGGTRTADSVEIYLADYRFEDNAEDYILDEWIAVDFSDLGPVDSLTFAFASSDAGDAGINTPAYVCIDQIRTRSGVSALAPVLAPAPRVYPNPATDVLYPAPVGGQTYSGTEEYVVSDAFGRTVAAGRLSESIPVRALAPGTYALRIRTREGWTAGAPFVRAGGKR